MAPQSTPRTSRAHIPRPVSSHIHRDNSNFSQNKNRNPNSNSAVKVHKSYSNTIVKTGHLHHGAIPAVSHAIPMTARIPEAIIKATRLLAYPGTVTRVANANTIQEPPTPTLLEKWCKNMSRTQIMKIEKVLGIHSSIKTEHKTEDKTEDIKAYTAYPFLPLEDTWKAYCIPVSKLKEWRVIPLYEVKCVRSMWEGLNNCPQLYGYFHLFLRSRFPPEFKHDIYKEYGTWSLVVSNVNVASVFQDLVLALCGETILKEFTKDTYQSENIDTEAVVGFTVNMREAVTTFKVITRLDVSFSILNINLGGPTLTKLKQGTEPKFSRLHEPVVVTKI